MVHLHMTPIGESKSLAKELVGENRFKVYQLPPKIAPALVMIGCIMLDLTHAFAGLPPQIRSSLILLLVLTAKPAQLPRVKAEIGRPQAQSSGAVKKDYPMLLIRFPSRLETGVSTPRISFIEYPG